MKSRYSRIILFLLNICNEFVVAAVASEICILPDQSLLSNTFFLDPLTFIALLHHMHLPTFNAQRFRWGVELGKVLAKEASLRWSPSTFCKLMSLKRRTTIYDFIRMMTICIIIMMVIDLLTNKIITVTYMFKLFKNNFDIQTRFCVHSDWPDCFFTPQHCNENNPQPTT